MSSVEKLSVSSNSSDIAGESSPEASPTAGPLEEEGGDVVLVNPVVTVDNPQQLPYSYSSSTPQPPYTDLFKEVPIEEGAEEDDEVPLPKADKQNRRTSFNLPPSNNLKVPGSGGVLGKNGTNYVLSTSLSFESNRSSKLDQADQSETAGSTYERLGRRESLVTLAKPFNCHALNHTKRRLLPLKHYHDEARAMKDIQKFLAHPVILFKIHYTTVHDIVGEMLAKLAMEKPQLNLDTDKLMSCIVEDDSDHKLLDLMQGMGMDENDAPETEQTFITIMCETNEVQENQVVMCLLPNPVNMGIGAEEVHFICLVISPIKEKKIKSAVEVARTYSTLLADYKLRRRLTHAHDSKEFAHFFELEVHRIFTEQRNDMNVLKNDPMEDDANDKWCFGMDFIKDCKRRLPHYLSDYTDGLDSCASVQKILSTTFFLYFAIIMPCIAFGVLHHYLTDGIIDVRKVILSQAFGGLVFAVFGGQPLIIIQTTVPIAIYTKVIYTISKNYEVDFHSFFALTGLWNSLFLMMYAFTGCSKLMKYCTRSTEEIFGLFISIAFAFDAIKYLVAEFSVDFCFIEGGHCNAPKALVALILMLGTVFVGCEIYNFRYSPYLTGTKRVFVADYALPTAVLIMAFVGSYLFRDVEMATFTDDKPDTMFNVPPLRDLSVGMVVGSMGLGFALSVLIFMDQNIASSMVNSPRNRLRKGTSYHLDLGVVAAINAVLSVCGMPWVHATLPLSPLHVRALADIEEHMDLGHLKEIVVYVRETRLTTVVSHILIALSLLMIPSPLNFIPIPVLYGLFLFLAISALSDFQLWERMLLIFTEQNAYPPTHYIRKVPQRFVHFFTFIQLFQLAILCAFSFSGSPYIKMLFPVLLALMMPIRKCVIPKLISSRYLDCLDGHA